MTIAAKANKVCKSMKKPMSIPSKTRKDQKAHEHSSKSEQGVQKRKKNMSITSKTRKDQKHNENSSNPCQKHLKPISIATKTLGPQLARRNRSSQDCEAQRWQTLLSHTPTQLRLARSLARTTRTRNETETNSRLGSTALTNSLQSPILQSSISV